MKLLLSLIYVLSTTYMCLAQIDSASKIKAVFNEYASNENITNAVLQVFSPTHQCNIRVYKDSASVRTLESMPQPFYTASITKMLTATAIGILKDNQQLSFEDKIHFYLPQSLINKLHVLNGIDYSKKITIAQLLQHTSGLPDYFKDTTLDNSPNIIHQLFIDNNKSWSPQQLIKFTKQKMKPHFIPGQGYHYTDTEYVLLGLLIEKVSGMSLPAFFQQYIFQPLAMNSSYINLKSTPIQNTPPLAKFYAGDIELSSFKSLSADWGGGGWVATTQDLLTFFKAFNEDRLVTKETRLAMQQWVYETKGMEYGYGIRKVVRNTLYNIESNLQLIGHNGSTASFLWYCPQLDTYIAGTLNQLEASKSTIDLVYNILTTIQNQ